MRSRQNPAACFRLFCLPYAGGGASIFRAWSDILPQEIEVCSIQLPGRENRLMDPLFTELEPLVQTLADIVLPHLDKPFALFGHSMGALVAFELCRTLYQKRMLSPVHLFVAGHRAPQLPNPREPTHDLPTPLLLEQLRRLNGTSKEVFQNGELMQLMLPILRADLAICETYRYVASDSLTCPLSAFGGLLDGEVGYGDLVAWQSQTSSTFTIRMFPGDHFFLHSCRLPLLQAIASDLAQYLR